MKKTAFIATLILSVLAPMTMAAKTAAKSTDPVVMTIGGEPVKLSEFEYLYNKNNSQQQVATSLDDYVDMFVNYKLKVRAAREAGLDTTQVYLNDLKGYSRDLAMPYMVDKAMQDSLVAAAYGHRMYNVAVRHILMSADDAHKQQMDSIRQLIVDGADFGEMAMRHSMDKRSGVNGGYVGFVSAGMFPYEFEDVAFNTPVGEMSAVFRTQYGYHLLKVEGRRNDLGEVKTRHILKQTRGLDADGIAAKRASIDSIAAAIRGGANFIEVADVETEDPYGRGRGGDLPWFGAGRMVPEFETTAFALADGELSEPVLSAFGYHLILREGYRATLPIDSLRADIEKAIEGDSRAQLAHLRALDLYARGAGAKTNAKLMGNVEKILTQNNGLNAASRAKLAKQKGNLYQIDGLTCTVADMLASLQDMEGGGRSVEIARGWLNSRKRDMETEAMQASLFATNTDYSNLVREYSDGMLLYEISSTEVWNRATADPEGLEAYFNTHRTEYVWDKPHYKGYVVMATTDSIADLASALLTQNNWADNQLGTELRKAFGSNVKIERVIVGQGDNGVVDHLAFGGAYPGTFANRWNAFRVYKGNVIDQPQEAADVKGSVSVAYQQWLEENWINSLRSRYAVEVNRDVLGQLR